MDCSMFICGLWNRNCLKIMYNHKIRQDQKLKTYILINSSQLFVFRCPKLI